MDDQSILGHIEALVAEEHALQDRERDDAAHGQEPAPERERLQAVSVELDRCWDLLRRRRALREAGADPDTAETRDASTVERYLQ
jgi:Protein of unknown function (DUF2630)